ncbi:MAG: AAA family ATPase [Candidatus Nanoarchaeia archaeon]|nr:AAA family ATPase [Candidatus Nanoarchaeia archaeon]
MKRLILLAGFPGVGKSYISKILESKIRGSYYFDSDKFAKEKSMKNVQYDVLSDKQIKRLRTESQRQKIIKIKQLFHKKNIIILDTCFDIPEARKMYYAIKSPSRDIIVLEVICSEKTIKKRILRMAHSPRNPGTPASRWLTYKKMKKNWKPVKWKNHFIINSDKGLGNQINAFIKKFTLL